MIPFKDLKVGTKFLDRQYGSVWIVTEFLAENEIQLNMCTRYSAEDWKDVWEPYAELILEIEGLEI